MNPPKLEICFEGYNTDQTDFYIGQLIEKINSLKYENDTSKERISYLEAENKQLRNELLMFVKQFRGGEASDPCKTEAEKESDAVFNESKDEVNNAIRESLKSLKIELDSVKEYIKNN